MTKRIRHNKRGSTYTVLGDATAQISVGDKVFGGHKLRVIADDMKLRVYQGADGELWARFPDEFDERFTLISDTDTPEDEGLRFLKETMLKFDQLDCAAMRVEDAVPHEMSAAIEALENARHAFGRHLREAVMMQALGPRPAIPSPRIPIPTPFVPAGCRQGMLKRATPGTPIPKSCPACKLGPCPYQSEVEKLP